MKGGETPLRFGGGIEMVKFDFGGILRLVGGNRKYSITVEGKTETHARQSAYARLGADHKLKRSLIKIESCKKQ